MHGKHLLRIAAATLVLIMPPLAIATEPKDFAGIWAMQVASRNFLVLTLTLEENGVRGALQRPATLMMTGSRFWNIGKGIRQDSILSSHFDAGILHLTTQNPNDPKDQSSFAMTINNGHASLAFEYLPAGFSMEPLSFERADGDVTVANDWNPERTYLIDDSDTPNAAMKAIFDEDQRVRNTDKIDWNIVGKSDSERRERTRKLLKDGSLHTGKDFEEASFVFQHGDTPQDYLLAHTLAMIAVAKGDSDAIWIASATLDRYLENIKQKQIFGTQYSSDNTGHWTQEPYDRNLISDALRRQLNVPSQAAQAKQLETYQNQK